MITAKGLEKRLRKMRVWTKFQKNLKVYGGSINHLVRERSTYRGCMYSSFTWDKTPEKHEFWRNIAYKIDEVKL